MPSSFSGRHVAEKVKLLSLQSGESRRSSCGMQPAALARSGARGQPGEVLDALPDWGVSMRETESRIGFPRAGQIYVRTVPSTLSGSKLTLPAPARHARNHASLTPDVVHVNLETESGQAFW